MVVFMVVREVAELLSLMAALLLTADATKPTAPTVRSRLPLLH